MSKKMHELREFLCDELEDMLKKVKKEGVKPQLVDYQAIDFLTHSIKSIDTIAAMEEYGEDDDEGYSERNRYPYNRDGGNSYARGRGRYAKRDSMGRYSRDNYSRGYRSNGYSREDGKEEMLSHLDKMMDKATDDRTRQLIMDWETQIESM